ncbi:hypothetical protein E8E11_005198 [Didymella keratinophila]|nr:hypothetical protein E8E11_005198 [Didymella keratinophila]
MAYSASGFVAKSLNKYNDGTPFLVDAAGQKILILMDPKHVKKALVSSELDAAIFVYKNIMPQLFGSPQAAVDHYLTPGHNMDEMVMLQIRTHTSGKALISLDQKFLEIIDRNIIRSFPSAQTKEWTNIPDLYTFFKQQSTLAVGEAILGTAMAEMYPQLAEDLWTLIERTDILLLGLPRPFAPAAYGARDRLLKQFKLWQRKSDAQRETDAVGKGWDAVAGSMLMQEREQMFSTLPGHDEDARAAQTLGMLYGGTSLSIPVTFWLLYEVLRDPALHKKVLDELQRYSATDPEKTNFAHLATSPFLQSLHSEATRFYARNGVTREVVAPVFQLDDHYAVEKGTTVLILTGHTARFTQEWARSRPHAIKRPLTEFWPERFLVPDGKSERYNESGLSGNWTSFGGGEHRCPGRFFARDIALVTLTMFLGKYEVKIVNPEGARKFDPVWNEIAFGTMVPKGKIAARIRRREV